jgi:hypothetical protein
MIGFVYAVFFDNGVVKVGRSVIDPNGRIRSHKHDMLKSGANALSTLVSQRIMNCDHVEREMIAKFSEVFGEPYVGKEWFKFDDRFVGESVFNNTVAAAIPPTEDDFNSHRLSNHYMTELIHEHDAALKKSYDNGVVTTRAKSVCNPLIVNGFPAHWNDANPSESSLFFKYCCCAMWEMPDQEYLDILDEINYTSYVDGSVEQCEKLFEKYLNLFRGETNTIRADKF